MRSYKSLYLYVLGITNFFYSCQKKYAVQEVEVKIEASEAVVQSGKRLTLSVCGPCHYNPDLKDLSGKQMLDIPKVIGVVYASNLTSHPQFGLKYTAGELKYLLKTGIKKSGSFSPYMAKPNLADKDIEAIVAFLQSDDKLIKPSESIRKTKYTPLGKFAVNQIFHPISYSDEVKKRPGPYDTIALGKYLVDIIGCYECHSSNILKTDRLFPENSKGYLGGGSKMKMANGRHIKTPNITFDKTGLGGWTEAEFARALQEGVTKDNEILSYPMPNYSSLTEEEIRTIYSYLKSIPPIKNNVKKKDVKPRTVSGERIYNKYGCSNCHGQSGRGIADLTEAYVKYSKSDIREMIKIQEPGSRMPAFDGIINERDYSYLVDYVIELGVKAKTEPSVSTK